MAVFREKTFFGRQVWRAARRPTAVPSSEDPAKPKRGKVAKRPKAEEDEAQPETQQEEAWLTPIPTPPPDCLCYLSLLEQPCTSWCGQPGVGTPSPPLPPMALQPCPASHQEEEAEPAAEGGEAEGAAAEGAEGEGEEEDEEDVPALEAVEAAPAGAAGEALRGRSSRSEKKTRKAMQRLGAGRSRGGGTHYPKHKQLVACDWVSRKHNHRKPQWFIWGGLCLECCFLHSSQPVRDC